MSTMMIAAGVVYVAFVAVAFGVRTAIQVRRTGDHGWVVAPSAAAALGDVLFALGVVGAAAASLLSVAVIGEPEVPILVQAGGLLLISAGGGGALVAQAQMGESWRAGVDIQPTSPLVVTGLFRYSRNPFYLGTTLATVGVALAVPSVVTAIAPFLVAGGSYMDARFAEEPALLRRHRTAYEQYCDRTPRFVPRLRRPWTP